MMKKSFIALTLILCLSFSGLALAQPGPGAQGKNMGPGCMAGFAPLAEFYQQEDVTKLVEQLDAKNKALFTLMGQKEVDEKQANTLHQEIKELKNQLDDLRFQAVLKFKKNNPDWQPGMGYGRGPGHHRGGMMGKAGGMMGSGRGMCPYTR